ncbi:hypothetical protein [Streptomyces sp. NPDC051310]|uniref:hypothetical protein n=1 Tax=Streptomyces sp. NPDC051310 TaxID=3365649 RepID=UPI003797294C
MANTSLRGRGGTGSPARRSLSAAARAAAKRAERAGEPAEGVVAGRTLRPEDPPPGAEAPEPDGESPDREGPDQPDGDLDRNADREGPDGETDPGGDASPARAGGSGRRRGLVCAVLALLIVLGLVAAAVLALEYREGRAAERARAGAAEAARKAAPVVLSYDHRHLDRDFAAARAHLTGSFRDEYRRTTTSVVAPTARKYRGVVRATVVAPPGGGEPAVSVVSASPDRAVVLLFVNQVTTSTQVSGPRVDLNRVRMTLARTSGGWKVSAVDAL